MQLTINIFQIPAGVRLVNYPMQKSRGRLQMSHRIVASAVKRKREKKKNERKKTVANCCQIK